MTLPGVAATAGYPDRLVRLIVPVAPGGGLDVIARSLSPGFAAASGQALVVENRPGASTNIGGELVARARPDGHTLLINTLPLVVNPSLFAQMPFDFEKDLVPVTLLGSSPFVLVVGADSPARSVRTLVAHAKSRPGRLNYGSTGIGTNLHLAAELFKQAAGLEIVHVPYLGVGQVLTALLAGDVDLAFLAPSSALPQIRAGKLRAFAVTSLQRSAVLPEVPTLAEAGLEGCEFDSWYGVLAPAGTPEAVVNRLRELLVRAVGTREVLARFRAEGIGIVTSTPSQFRTHLHEEFARSRDVLRKAGIRPG